MTAANTSKFPPEKYIGIASNHLVVYAIYSLQNDGDEISAEDIISACFTSFPKKFSLRTYPHWPDSALVGRRLRDCERNGWLSARIETGFKLTARGMRLAEKAAKELGMEIPRKEKPVGKLRVDGSQGTEIGKLEVSRPTLNVEKAEEKQADKLPVRETAAPAPTQPKPAVEAKAPVTKEPKPVEKVVAPVAQAPAVEVPKPVEKKAATPAAKPAPAKVKPAKKAKVPAAETPKPAGKIATVPSAKPAVVKPKPAEKKATPPSAKPAVVKPKPAEKKATAPSAKPAVVKPKPVEKKATAPSAKPAVVKPKPAEKKAAVTAAKPAPVKPKVEKKKEKRADKLHVAVVAKPATAKPLKVEKAKEKQVAEAVKPAPTVKPKPTPKPESKAPGVAVQKPLFQVPAVSAEEKAKAGKFVKMMEGSDAYRLYKKNGANANIGEFDFRSLLLCTMESSHETLARNVELFKGYAEMHNRQDLVAFLAVCRDKFAHLLAPEKKAVKKFK